MSASVVSVPSRIIDSLSSTFKSLCAEKISECAKLYNFDAEEAIRRLDLEFTVAAVKSVAAKKEKSLEPTKKSFPMPFCGKNDGCCNALKFNHGLYTQCPATLAEGTTFCNACTKASAKTEGKMPYGTVDERLAVGLMDYRDPKGKAPTPYCKIMKKLSLTEDMVNAEAENAGITVDAEHFVVVEPKKGGRPKKSESEDEAAGSDTGAKKRGRPKKSAVVQEEGASDELFASLVAEAQDNMSDISTDSKKKGKLSEEEKAAKAAEREAKKLQKEQEAAEKKAQKEQEKEEKKAAAEALKAQKEQEKLEKKAEKDAQREAKKAAEEAEREAKKAAKEAAKAAKEAEKNEKIASLAAASAPELSGTPVMPASPEPINTETKAETNASANAASANAASANAATKVKKFKFGGVEYLRSGTNVVYSKDTHEEIGIWDPEAKKIVLNEESSDSEEEEEEMEEGEEK
jgi:hypothetical protein